MHEPFLSLRIERKQLLVDFTVLGPAVNEVSRIAAMCRSVDQLERTP
jgi:class 3 adenylate cyclase